MPSSSHSSAAPQKYHDDSIDFMEMLARLRRGLPLILGLASIGIAIGILLVLLTTNQRSVISTLRVTFGFQGFEHGTYPNGTKFQADDLRAPDVVNEAISRLGIKNAPPDLASKIRGAIGISGFVSPTLIKERDRLRASGQNVPPYFPDEYEITLSLPRDFALDVRQRELLLAEISNVYLEKFRRTYVALPPEFGDAFASLKNADFVEYELILTKEVQSLISFLEQQSEQARQFRSPTNNLSFQDLLKHAEFFSQIRLNDVLGLIYINGLSRDRTYAMVKMDYYLRTLGDQEMRLKEEESVVTNLLGKTQERTQNYVLGIKSQAAQSRPEAPLLDQGLIDSLLANDSYNFLVRKALDAGLAVKRIQSDIAKLQDRRRRMESFMKGEVKDQAAAISATQKALGELELDYHNLLSKVRTTMDDFSRQEYADAMRISMQARTSSLLMSLLLGALVGCGTGLALGLGLALINSHQARSS